MCIRDRIMLAAYATCDDYPHNAYPWRFLNLKIYWLFGVHAGIILCIFRSGFDPYSAPRHEKKECEHGNPITPRVRLSTPVPVQVLAARLTQQLQLERRATYFSTNENRVKI